MENTSHSQTFCPACGRFHDTLYAEPVGCVGDFRFDERVVQVFPDMIERSVPGYGAVIHGIGVLAGRHAQAGSRCYDLGCSLGAATRSMMRRMEEPGVRIVAVDNSMAMVQRCREVLLGEAFLPSVDLVCADIQDVMVSNASVVVLNFTLQFIPVQRRPALIAGIYRGLRPGGVLLLSEKVRFQDPVEDDFQVDMHHSFKAANGYSDLEISRKRAALERVLLPETVEEHRERIAAAGFSAFHVWFQCFNFVSMLARK